MNLVTSRFRDQNFESVSRLSYFNILLLQLLRLPLLPLFTTSLLRYQECLCLTLRHNLLQYKYSYRTW